MRLKALLKGEWHDIYVLYLGVWLVLIMVYGSVGLRILTESAFFRGLDFVLLLTGVIMVLFVRAGMNRKHRFEERDTSSAMSMGMLIKRFVVLALVTGGVALIYSGSGSDQIIVSATVGIIGCVALLVEFYKSRKTR